EPKPKKYDLALKPVKRRPATRTTPTKDSSSDIQESKLVENRRRQISDAIGTSSRSLRSDLSSSTTIDADPGTGGGPSYASYAAVVRSIYEHAWIPPDETASDDAVTKVTVTIARDGRVLSCRIVRGSGDSSVDKSVQRTLDRVTFIAPFPE